MLCIIWISPLLEQPGGNTPQASVDLGVIQSMQQISKRVLQTAMCETFPGKITLFLQLFTVFVISSEAEGTGE